MRTSDGITRKTINMQFKEGCLFAFQPSENVTFYIATETRKFHLIFCNIGGIRFNNHDLLLQHMCLFTKSAK